VTNLITFGAFFYYDPIEFGPTGNSAIRSADSVNPSLEPNMEWIGCTICEIFAFKLYCDLKTGVRGHSMSSIETLSYKTHTTLYSSSIVTASVTKNQNDRPIR